MNDDVTPAVRNQDTDPRYNAEGGLAIIPGSPHQREMARWEQFPGDKWAMGNPGNPYRYRPFPKMVYRAERSAATGGKIKCLESAPDRLEFRGDAAGDRSFALAEEAARRFSERCQLIVHDESEYQRAMENGYRETPEEACKYLEARENARSQEIAHRNYDDRNLSEAARAEIAAAELAAGEPLPEIPEGKRSRKRTD